MKKLILVLLIVVTVFSVCVSACQNSETETVESDNAPVVIETEVSPFTTETPFVDSAILTETP